MNYRDLAWQGLGPEKRKLAALAFWSSKHTTGEHPEAVSFLAKRLKSRPSFVARLANERKASHLSAQMTLPPDVWDSVMLAYHLEAQRPMLKLFLDSVGIENDGGFFKEGEDLRPLAPNVIARGVTMISAAHSSQDVFVYLTALALQNEEFWMNLVNYLPSLAQKFLDETARRPRH